MNDKHSLPAIADSKGIVEDGGGVLKLLVQHHRYEDMSERSAQTLQAVADLQFAEPARQATLQAKEETKRQAMGFASSLAVDAMIVAAGALAPLFFPENTLTSVAWYLPFAMFLVIARHAGPGMKSVIERAIDKIWG